MLPPFGRGDTVRLGFWRTGLLTPSGLKHLILPALTLGMMISTGQHYIYAGMWWMVVFPGAALVMIVVGINLFADWLREELNPKI